MKIVLNGEETDVPDSWADESLLNVLREHFDLKGAKFGCGVGLCGACTVIVDGQATRSCVYPVSSVDGASVRTIEGLAEADRLHPVQKAWLEQAVPQCGYCQAGQIMSAVALLEQNPAPDVNKIDTAMDGNLCRCGTYERIRAAIASVARQS